MALDDGVAMASNNQERRVRREAEAARLGITVEELMAQRRMKAEADFARAAAARGMTVEQLRREGERKGGASKKKPKRNNTPSGKKFSPGPLDSGITKPLGTSWSDVIKKRLAGDA